MQKTVFDSNLVESSVILADTIIVFLGEEEALVYFSQRSGKYSFSIKLSEMDPQKLIDLLRATMEQQPEQRKAAEEQLTQVSKFFIPHITNHHMAKPKLGFPTKKNANYRTKEAFSTVWFCESLVNVESSWVFFSKRRHKV